LVLLDVWTWFEKLFGHHKVLFSFAIDQAASEGKKLTQNQNQQLLLVASP